MTGNSFKCDHNGLIRITCVGLIALVWGLAHWGWRARERFITDVRAVTAVSKGSATRPIETIRVGDRVLARNPEVTDAERAARIEPNWAEWYHVSLELPINSDNQARATPKQVMKIELLRPEDWLLERIGYSGQLREEHDRTHERLTDAPHSAAALATIPEREFFLESARIANWLNEQGFEVRSKTVELDLLEMGAVGSAVITRIAACPEIKPGAGQVVTATFVHPPATQVLDVRFRPDSFEQAVATDGKVDQSLPLGVTDNHPFWSVDAQRFVPIGQLNIGQRVVTHQGETKRIASKLARAAPQTVYNLEVYGEQVYFVGVDGLLAHNNCELGQLGEKAAKGWLQRHGYSEIMQFQNRSGHGIDVVARHRDGTLTFFEVKTSAGARAPGLSNAQSDQEGFISKKLEQAARGSAWWRSTPSAVRGQARTILDDLRGGAKYRRYVIEITNATNSKQLTQFRILPW